MKRLARPKCLALLAGSGMLLQLSACLGPDPQFFLAASAANALVADLIGRILNALLSGATV